MVYNPSLLTEAEAHGQPCPFFQQTTFDGQDRPLIYHERCMEAACKMGWRWDREASMGELTKQAEGGESKAPLGYCGLAGKP